MNKLLAKITKFDKIVPTYNIIYYFLTSKI